MNGVCGYPTLLFYIISFVFIIQENQVLGDSIDDEPQIRQQRQPIKTTTTTKTKTKTTATAGETYAPSATEEDESSLLDLFGESAKDFLTHRLIPTTDASCRWNWKNLRCESHCACTFQPLLGDYHLGRSCRKRPAPLPVDELDVCHLPPEDNPLHHIRAAMTKLNLDLSGTATLIKGEVCESWLSSDVEGDESGDVSENGGLNGERLPPHGDGGKLSKPINKLRKLFKCDAGFGGDEWMRGEGGSSGGYAGSDFPTIMVSETM